MDFPVLITTSKNPEGTECIELCRELELTIPRSCYVPASEAFPEHSAVVKVVENASAPFCIRVTDACGEVEFKVISYRSKKSLRNRTAILPDGTELVVHNFCSKVGEEVVDRLSRLFPLSTGNRQVASFQCMNDFIFFRLYRYIFQEGSIDFQDIGPHLTLRLKRLSTETETIYEYRKYDKKSAIL